MIQMVGGCLFLPKLFLKNSFKGCPCFSKAWANNLYTQ